MTIMNSFIKLLETDIWHRLLYKAQPLHRFTTFFLWSGQEILVHFAAGCYANQKEPKYLHQMEKIRSFHSIFKRYLRNLSFFEILLMLLLSKWVKYQQLSTEYEAIMMKNTLFFVQSFLLISSRFKFKAVSPM